MSAQRICITGGPRTGKTTLAEYIGNALHIQNVRHTDDVMHLGWSAASEAVAAWFNAPGPWIIEGVAVSRALRKWRAAHPGEPPPVDRVIYLEHAHEPLSRGQYRMSVGVETVHAEIEEWLADHGVVTERQ